MKFNLEWHEDSLRNSKNHAKRLREEAERAVAAANRADRDVAFYELQVETALGMKKTGFDAEKFLKSKRPV